MLCDNGNLADSGVVSARGWFCDNGNVQTLA